MAKFPHQGTVRASGDRDGTEVRSGYRHQEVGCTAGRFAGNSRFRICSSRTHRTRPRGTRNLPEGPFRSRRTRRRASRFDHHAARCRPSVQATQEEAPPRLARSRQRSGPPSSRRDCHRFTRSHRRRDRGHSDQVEHRGRFRRHAHQGATVLHLQAALHRSRRLLPPTVPRLRCHQPQQT